MKKCILFLVLASAQLIPEAALAQQAPAADQNFAYLVTFGKKAERSWGDDDFVQIFFFSVPQVCNQAVYLRVYDPDVGGKVDENRGGFNTKTKFTVYGGTGAHSDPAARKHEPVGNYKSGIQLATKTFDGEATWDEKWYTFGPFSPIEGELQPEFGGYIFKIVIEGIEGDDGNLYKMFLSSKKEENVDMEGGNSFTYEFCLRVPDNAGTVCHIYPFVSSRVIAVKTSIFDYDSEGFIRTVSVAKKGDVFRPGGDGNWVEHTHVIVEDEYNTSLDIQFVKQAAVKNNNIAVYITNQYGDLLPFYTVPIGGVPRYKYKIGIKAGK